MLTLYCNDDGIYVYNPDDWSVLRKTHRIIGEVVGSTNFIPKLPIKLLPEEVLLLIEDNIVKVLKTKEHQCSDTITNDSTFERNLLEEQRIIYKNNRKRQLENFKDDLLEAKRKKGDNRPTEEILEEELERSCQVTEENMIWPILNEPLSLDTSIHEEVPKEDILSRTTILKFKVFRDLWHKGYYITSGHKFGGDYLVYLGDPVAYHAIFIVRCVEDVTSAINAAEIVAFGRLGTSVKKRAVLASVNEDGSISYITINWIDA